VLPSGNVVIVVPSGFVTVVGPDLAGMAGVVSCWSLPPLERKSMSGSVAVGKSTGVSESELFGSPYVNDFWTPPFRGCT
jgi:hypothetical protein